MIYKVKVKNDKASAFFQMMQTLKQMNILEEVSVYPEDEIVENSNQDLAMLWSDEVRKDLGSVEQTINPGIYADFD